MKWPWSKAKKPMSQMSGVRNMRSPSIDFSTNYLIPAWEVSQDTKFMYRKVTIEKLEAKCREKTGCQDVIVRQLLARDLGLRSWHTPRQVAGERTVWIDSELKQSQFVAITGVIQLSRYPRVSSVIIRMGYSGATTLGHLNIDELYSILPIIKKLETFREGDELYLKFKGLENVRMAALFTEPYSFEQSHIVHITVESPEGNKAGDKLMLSGFIAEPNGMTIAW